MISVQYSLDLPRAITVVPAWQKSAQLYNELRSESSLELKLCLAKCMHEIVLELHAK